MTGRVRVLLLEDDPEYVLLMKTFVGEPGEAQPLRLTEADTLEAGLGLLARGGFDAVLLDLMLPDSRGLETLDRVLARAPQIPVVVLTGLYDEALALEAVSRGAQDYLVKATFDARLLKRSVAYAIERARSRADLRSVLDGAADPMVVVGEGGLVRYANAAAEAFFGRPAADWVGRPFGHPVEPGKTSEVRVEAPEAGERVGELRAARLTWRREEARLASIRDITALRRMEQIKAEIRERRRMDELKDQLLSTVSHELRSPLTVIKAAVANLLEGFVGPMPDEQMRLVALAHRNVERLARIINNLLDLSRLESDQVRVSKAPLDVGTLIRDAAQGFALSGRERRVAIEVELAPGLPPALADADLLAQVLSNLIDNAVRFARSRVVVSAAPVAAAAPARPSREGGAALAEDQGVRITVADDGRGIPRARLPELFNKFVQVGRPAGGGGYKGTGLGLAICKQIVERHGGRIWAESEEGAGARFHLVLPRAPGARR